MTPIRGLVCDFGGVAGSFSHTLVARRVAELGRCSEEAAFDHIFRSGLEEEFDCGRLTSREFLARLRAECDISEQIADESLELLWRDIFTRTPENDRVISVLRRVPRAVRLVLASNTNEIHFRGIELLFRDLVTSCDDLVLSFRVGCRKPGEPYYRRVLQAAGVPAAEILFLDDVPAFVEAARATVGMQGVVYTPGLDLAETLARYGVRLTDEPRDW